MTRLKLIMKHAVDHVYHLLLLKEEDPVEYESKIRFGVRYTAKWDEPQIPKRRRPGPLHGHRTGPPS
jgi:hypothetical protein